jgi:hypothetical protein
MILNVASLMLQLLAGPVLQSKIGVVGTLLILPVSLLGTAATTALWATLGTRTALRITEGGLKLAVHRAAWEQTFLPVDREARGIAKVTVDGLSARSAEVVAALLLYAWVCRYSVDLSLLAGISWIIVASVSAWGFLTWRLKRVGCASLPADEAVIRLPDSCPMASALGEKHGR